MTDLTSVSGAVGQTLRCLRGKQIACNARALIDGFVEHAEENEVAANYDLQAAYYMQLTRRQTLKGSLNNTTYH